MGQGWIIDVLTDLRTFAQLNGLPQLAAKLEETTRIAAGEIAAAPAEGVTARIATDGTGHRDFSWTGREGTRT